MLLGNSTLWFSQENNSAHGDMNKFAFVLGEHKATSQATDANRASNLAVAAEALDGTLIMPGDALSLNKVLGDTENDPAYAEAPAFDGSSVIFERGGGICQLASALYVAAIQADLGIAERHPHTMACDYVALGLDATISYGEKDLVVRNDSATPVRIDASAQGQSVTVSINGEHRSDGVTFEAVSKTTNMYSIPAESAPDDLSLVEWSNDETATYYIVESYKVKYIDGIMQDSTLLATNAYLVPNEEPQS